MKIQSIKKVRDGKYLKNYELNYINKAGKPKIFEIVSYRELESIDDIGTEISGVAIVAIKDNKLLLLHEFRMGANRYVYNLCAGRIEKGESLEDCVKRELYEETGLELVEIIDVLRPAYAAVTLSDVSNQLVFAKVKGEISDNTSENEEITAAFYDKIQVKNLLANEDFTSRAQSVAYSFINNIFDGK